MWLLDSLDTKHSKQAWEDQNNTSHSLWYRGWGGGTLGICVCSIVKDTRRSS